MRVKLIPDRCVGHAQCFAVNEELFPIDDDGYSTFGDRDFGPDDETPIRQGVRACPEQALVIVE